MARPVFPNDFIHGHGYLQETLGSVSVVAERDFATHSTAGLEVVDPDDFSAIEIDKETLYEISAGPFILINGQVADTTTARDGAIAGVRFTYDQGAGAVDLGDVFGFTLRRAHPNNIYVPRISTYYYSSVAETVKFGLVFNHRGGAAIPGGDMTNAMPTRKTTTTQIDTASNTTEVKDTGLGDMAFTAKTGRTYRIMINSVKAVKFTNTGTLRIRVRDGGGSSPTTSSALVAERNNNFDTTTAAGERLFPWSFDWVNPSAGTHTIAPFIQGDGADVKRLIGDANMPREFIVQDITEAVALTDGKIQFGVYGSHTPMILGVRPVAEAQSLKMIPLFT